jgi:hypothetical protein
MANSHEALNPDIEISPSGEATLSNINLAPNETGEFQPEEMKKEGKLSNAFKVFRGRIVPAVLEGGSMAWKAFNKGVDWAAEAINVAVPATTEAISGFILPAHLDRLFNKTVAGGTKVATYLGKNFAKISVNVFTFGAPAWIDAFRQGLAVNDANQEFKEIKTGTELTAVSFLDHLKEGSIKAGLKEYYDSRQQLAELRDDPEKNREKIIELAGKIASYEVNYKDNADFFNLKGILEGGQEFMSNNEALISQLAEETADKMIANVENHYKNQVGGAAGKVEGKWMDIITSPEKGRQKLVESIAVRLREVMSAEIGDAEVQKEMKKINKELISAFGVYRKFLKASVYLILKEMPLVKEGLESLGVWQPIAEAVHNGYDTVSGWVGDGVKETWSWVWSSLDEEYHKVLSYVSGAIKDFLKGIMDEITTENMKKALEEGVKKEVGKLADPKKILGVDYGFE